MGSTELIIVPPLKPMYCTLFSVLLQNKIVPQNTFSKANFAFSLGAQHERLEQAQCFTTGLYQMVSLYDPNR